MNYGNLVGAASRNSACQPLQVFQRPTSTFQVWCENAVVAVRPVVAGTISSVPMNMILTNFLFDR